MGKVLDNLHYVGDAVALATLQPELIPAIEGANSAAQTYSKTHNFGDALKSGAGSYAGSYLGGQIGGAAGNALGLGTVGSNITDALGTGGLSNFVGNSLPAGIGSLSTGALLGGMAGNAIGSSLTAPAPKQPGPPAPFQPTQAAAAPIPASLSGMSSLTPVQQASSLATQGSFGNGLGPDEKSYFTNLLNRQLVDQSGHVAPLSSLPSVEGTYLQKLGLGGQPDSTSLLKALTTWQPT